MQNLNYNNMFLKNLAFGFFIFNLLLVLMIEASHAEYRVYQYSIKPKKLYEVDVKPYLVTSTLDPVSYVSYHGGRETVSVDLLRTWMCKGHTGQLRSYCPSPYEKAKEVKNF